WQKSGRPAGGARSGACGARSSRAQRATRLWVDRDAPRELALPTKRTERRCVAGSAARVGSRAAALRLSAAVHFPTTGEDRGRNAAVASQPQARVSAVPGGRAGDTA